MLQHIKNTIATTKVEPLLQHLLEQIITYPNVPRKKFKFENFIKNCLRCGNVKYINKAWEIFDKAQKQKSQNSKDNKPEEVENEKNETDNSTDAKNPENGKVDKRKKKHKENKGQNDNNDSVDVINNENNKTNKRKRKEDEENTEESKRICLGEVTESSHIKNTIATTKVEPLLQHLLEQIITYPNVPRKKFKFENFIKNCLRCGNVKYINKAWEIFDKAQKQKSQNSKDNKPEEVENEKNETDNSTDAKNPENGKVDKRKKKHKENKGQNDNNDSVDVINNENNKTNKRKRKEDEENTEESKRICLGEVTESSVNNAEEEKKFKWSRVILEIMNKYVEKGISLKKLQKKALEQYFAMVEEADQLPKDKVILKFHKKLKRIPNINISNDRVNILQD
ncbi:cell growth-regulating nucleolar protein-like [Centruroides sculpturatus]|uniref:cell growth-regulating nucleolar protein-like n=1 Tax=Centruroides sculpturatus TaxID=218467 RepID=UPI000C6E3040|nr:cell growth-regulating nucleolar protein-like [Centruroides sculpturatus]